MSGTGTSSLGWYARRLSRMSPAEITWRIREQALRRGWARRQVRPGEIVALPPLTAVLPVRERRFTSPLPAGLAAEIPAEAKAAIIGEAGRLLKGEWETLGVIRTDMEHPDWFGDPVTGRRSAPEAYSFSLDHRDESAVGNIKRVWEVNRLQHLTLLAVAWYLTGGEEYAARVADQLQSWWRENPFLSGINWTSGIELGIRLINFAWIRRLLDGWPPVADLFERSDMALRQIRWHQEYLAAFESRGSSANNHVIAEAAGQLAASCAFPWFPESVRWRRDSLGLLARALARNTFPCGINRELASDYHGFVAELGLYAVLEASAAGFPAEDSVWRLLCSMADAMAALTDVRTRPPRQGDSDEGRVVLLDAPAHNRWPALLSLSDAIFGRLAWWPPTVPDAGSTLASALLGARQQQAAGRPSARPDRFPGAGLTILRTDPGVAPELWCRCDGGPHGFGSIAAHAHADALSVEIRCDGVDILADPGTYCYHGEADWRQYFQSTIGHNTVEVGGQWQSSRGGAFLWLRHAAGREIEVADDGRVASWTGSHDGYAVLRPAATHQRSVHLDRVARCVLITDTVTGAAHDIRVAFHLGPDVLVDLMDSGAALSWPRTGAQVGAKLELPGELTWSLHRGEIDPIVGWYSPGLGHKIPSFTLIGVGHSRPGVSIATRLRFDLAEASHATGDHMNQEQMSARRTMRIIRRYKQVIVCASIIGCVSGIGYGAVSGQSFTSQALIVLPAPLTTSQVNTTVVDAMQAVVATSDPVLSKALAELHNPASLATLRGDISVNSPAPNVLVVSATTSTAVSSQNYANVVARTYVSYARANPVLLSGMGVKLLQPAAVPAAPSVVTTYGLMALLGALSGAVIGFFVALAASRGDRRLRERGEVANAVGLPVLAAFPVARAVDAAGWMKLLSEYKPSAVDAWQLRNVIEQLGITSRHAHSREPTSVAVTTLSSDSKAMALGPQLAAFAASRGIPTTLLIGSRQDTVAVAALRTAGAAYTPDSSTRSRCLRVLVPDRRGVMPQPDRGLAVHVVVVDDNEPEVPHSMHSMVTILGLSSGTVNAAQLARAATAVTDAGSYILGILLADPESSDFTTGLDPKLGRPVPRRLPNRMSGMPTEISQ